jgi:hypothetical protein
MPDPTSSDTPALRTHDPVAYEAATELLAAGVPIFIARPRSADPYDYQLPEAWHRTAVDPAVLAAWRPGDGLGAVMGHALDLVDVDPRSGGDASYAGLALSGAAPLAHAAAATPSGGYHYFVTAMGEGSHDVIRPGLDVKGGKADGSSRGFAWIAPTVRRSKVTGEPTPYRWVARPSAELIAENSRGDDSGASLADIVRDAFAIRRPAATISPALASDLFVTAGRSFTPEEALAYVKPHYERFAGLRDGIDSGYNAKLNALAVMLGHFVPEFMSFEQAGRWLYQAAQHNGSVAYQGARTVERTIRSGLEAGQREPYRKSHPEDLTGNPLTSRDAIGTGGDAWDTPAATPEVEGSTWDAEDLGAVLDGTFTPIEPTLFVRNDDQYLLYPGLVHSFHGESESGKSMVAQYACAEVLKAGGRAAYIDFESDAPTVVGRILLMGASVEQIKAGLTYRRPAVMPTGADRERYEAMMSEPCDLTVIDGVTESMGIFGIKSLDNDEVTRWMRGFPRRLARTSGAAVVLIDHVTKSQDSRGRFAIGAQAKLASLDGAAYVVEVRQPLGRGLRGAVSLRIAKDRPGAVRPSCGSFAEDRTQEAAYIVIDSSGPAGRIIVDVRPPIPDDEKRSDLLVAISMSLEGLPVGISQTAVCKSVTGKATAIRHALNQLIALGYVELEKHGSALLHKSIKPYRKPVTSGDAGDAVQDGDLDPYHDRE